MKIASILPRHMLFDNQYATTIDFCVKEYDPDLIVAQQNTPSQQKPPLGDETHIVHHDIDVSQQKSSLPENRNYAMHGNKCARSRSKASPWAAFSNGNG
jgi:hypothetical protein